MAAGRDGAISGDFAMIQDKLEKISMTADALQLWVRERIATGKIDQKKLDSYKKQIMINNIRLL
jgi:hypothetical protein